MPPREARGTSRPPLVELLAAHLSRRVSPVPTAMARVHHARRRTARLPELAQPSLAPCVPCSRARGAPVTVGRFNSVSMRSAHKRRAHPSLVNSQRAEAVAEEPTSSSGEASATREAAGEAEVTSLPVSVRGVGGGARQWFVEVREDDALSLGHAVRDLGPRISDHTDGDGHRLDVRIVEYLDRAAVRPDRDRGGRDGGGVLCSLRDDRDRARRSDAEVVGLTLEGDGYAIGRRAARPRPG